MPNSLPVMFSNNSICLSPRLSLLSHIPVRLLSHQFRIAFIFLSFSIFLGIIQSPFLSPRLLPCALSLSLSPALFLFFLSLLLQSCSSNCNLFAILNFALRPSSRMQPRSTTVTALERGQQRIVYDPVNFPVELLEGEI